MCLFYHGFQGMLKLLMQVIVFKFLKNSKYRKKIKQKKKYSCFIIFLGKSVRNEDQAAFHRGVLRTKDADSRVQFSEDWEIPYIYFGIFDGHAGSGCAVTAANELHQVMKYFYKR